MSAILNHMSAPKNGWISSVSTSAVENCDLCWKCQSLLNSQSSKSLVITDSRKTQKDPDKQFRRIRTVNSVEATASDGCILCLHLFHALGVPAKAALRQLTSVSGKDSNPDIVYEYELFLSKGNPNIALRIDPDNLLKRDYSDEIKCLLELFPEAGRS